MLQQAHRTPRTPTNNENTEIKQMKKVGQFLIDMDRVLG